MKTFIPLFAGLCLAIKSIKMKTCVFIFLLLGIVLPFSAQTTRTFTDPIGYFLSDPVTELYVINPPTASRLEVTITITSIPYGDECCSYVDVNGDGPGNYGIFYSYEVTLNAPIIVYSESNNVSIGVSARSGVFPTFICSYKAVSYPFSSNGYLGIGTNKPLNGLHVYKNNDFYGGSIRFSHSSSYDGIMSFGYNSQTTRDALKFSYLPNNTTTGLIDLMTLDVNGNVGIGTTTPGAKLSFGNLNDGRNTADGITWYSPDPLSYGLYRTSGSWSAPNYQQLKMSWATGIIIDGGSAYDKSGTVIQPAGGNVLIGKTTQTNSSYKLDVEGAIYSTVYNGSYIDLTNADGANIIFRHATGYPDGLIRSNSTTRGLDFLTWNGSFSEAIRILGNGNILIGKTSQTNTDYKLDVAGTVNATSFIGDGSGLTGVSSSQWTTSGSNIYFNTTEGKVGIGTATPDYKLDVVGDIRAHKVRVNIEKTADFVFDPSYKLPKIGEVESYITTHKHLPEIPSASEMKEKGVDMSELQVKLLQKIEELTLYTIAQEKSNQALKQQVEMLKQEVEMLKKTKVSK